MGLMYALKLPLLQSQLFQYIRNKIRYPDLDIHPSARIKNWGKISYSKTSQIDEYTIIIINEYGHLKLGENCRIGRYVEISPSDNIILGENVSIQDRSILLGNIIIHNNSFLSLNILLTSGTHIYDYLPEITIKEQDLLALEDEKFNQQLNKPIIIEEDCWIGMNAIIMPGVHIGKGCVVAANSVVTNDISPYSVVGGNPACCLKKRLIFNPPLEIHAGVEKDLPYFYRGFKHSPEAVSIDKKSYLIAKSNFSIWLDYSQTGSMCLEIKSIGESIIFTKFSEKFSIRSEWVMVHFLSPKNNEPLNFLITGDEVMIRKAHLIL